MILTQASQKIIAQNQRKAFLEKGADILMRLFPDVIRFRQIPRQALSDTVEQCYQWAEEHYKASQLLAVRLACAKLCYGSFFMQDRRYTELTGIVTEQVNKVHLTDDDPIYQYLLHHKPDWSEDAFLK